VLATTAAVDVKLEEIGSSTLPPDEPLITGITSGTSICDPSETLHNVSARVHARHPGARIFACRRVPSRTRCENRVRISDEGTSNDGTRAGYSRIPLRTTAYPKEMRIHFLARVNLPLVA